jgi:hypothetical protein
MRIVVLFGPTTSSLAPWLTFMQWICNPWEYAATGENRTIHDRMMRRVGRANFSL